MALTRTALGTAATTTTGTTATFTLGGSDSVSVGDLIVVCVAIDNTGASGAAPATLTVTDSAGNTYTLRSSGLQDPSTASAGAYGAIFTATAQFTLGSSSTITVTTGSAAAIAMTVQKFSAGAGNIAQYDTNGGNAGSNTTATVTTGSITNGGAVVGMAAIERGNSTKNLAVTADSDTTNGSWTTQQTAQGNNSSTSTADMTVVSQSKIVTATATQTYNISWTTATDFVIRYITITEVSSAQTLSVPVFASSSTLNAPTVSSTFPLPSAVKNLNWFALALASDPNETLTRFGKATAGGTTPALKVAPSGTITEANPFTITLWYKPTSTATNYYGMAGLLKSGDPWETGGAGVTNDAFGFHQYGTQLHLYYSSGTSYGSEPGPKTGTGFFTANEWKFIGVVVTPNATGFTADIYGGSPTTGATFVTTITGGGGGSASWPTTLDVLGIGSIDGSNANANGNFGEVRYWNAALTASEVEAERLATTAAKSGVVIDVGFTESGASDAQGGTITAVGSSGSWSYAATANDGDSIGTWRDASGNGWTFSESTSGQQPTFRGSVSALNNKPALEFQAALDQMLSTVNFGSRTKPMTIVVVARSDAPPLGDYANIVGTNGCALGFDITSPNAGMFAYDGTNLMNSAGTGFKETPTSFFAAAVINGSSSKYIVGSTEVTGDTGTNGFGDMLTLGAYNSSQTIECWDGWIALAGVITGDATADPDWGAFLAWVSNEYGVTVPTTSMTLAPPVLSAAATLLAPGTTQQQFVQPPVLDASSTLYAPVITQPQSIAAPVLSVTSTLYAPDVSFIVFIDKAQRKYSIGGATNPLLDLPAGAAVGDLLIGFYASRDATNFTPPAGWTAIGESDSSNSTIAACWKFYESGDPTSWAGSVDTNRRCATGVIALRGANPSSPIVGSTTNFNNADSSPVWTGRTVGLNGSMLVGGAATVATTNTEPATTTERIDFGSGSGSESSGNVWTLPVDAGASGDFTGTIGGGTIWATILVEVAPASGTTLAGVVLATSNTLYAPTLTQQQVAQPPVITTTNTLYAPKLNLFVAAPAISTTATLLAPRVNLSMTTPVLTTTNTLYGPKLNLFMSAPVLATTVTLLSPTMVSTVALPAYVSTASLLAPTVIRQQFVQPPVLSAPATLLAGAVRNLNTLVAPVYASTASLLAPYVNAVQTASAPVITTTSTLYAGSVANRQLVSPPVLTTTATIFSPNSLTFTIFGAVYNSTSSLLAPTVGTGVTLTAPVLATTTILYDPKTAFALTAPVYTSTSSVLTPSMTQQQFVAPPVYASTASLLAPQVNLKVSAPVYTSSSSLLAPTMTQQSFVQPPAYASTASMLAPSITTLNTLDVPVYTSTSSVLTPAMTQQQFAQPPVISTTTTLYEPTELSLRLTGAVYTSTATVLAPTLNRTYTATAPLLTTTSTLYAPRVQFDVSVPVYASSSSLLTPAVLVQSFVQPPVYSAPATLLEPSLSAIGTISAPLLTTTSTLYAPVMTQQQFVTAPVYTSNININAPTTINRQLVEPPVLDTTAVLYGPSTTFGPMLPPVLTTTATLLAPSITLVISTQVITTGNNFYAPTVQPRNTVEPPLLITSSTLYQPSAFVGNNLLTPVLSTTATLYGPTVLAAQTVTAPSLTTTATVYAGAVAPTNTVRPPLITTSSTVYSPSTSYAMTTPLLDTTTTLYTPKVNHTITAPVLSTGNTLNPPRVASSANLPTLYTTSTVNAPAIVVTQHVELPVIDAGTGLYAPHVQKLLQAAQVPLLVGDTTIYGPTLASQAAGRQADIIWQDRSTAPQYRTPSTTVTYVEPEAPSYTEPDEITYTDPASDLTYREGS